jgi:hypothetical protein
MWYVNLGGRLWPRFGVRALVLLNLSIRSYILIDEKGNEAEYGQSE